MKKKSYLLKTNYRFFSFYSSISDVYGKMINLRVYNRFHDSDLVLPRLSSIICSITSIRYHHHRLAANTIHEYCETNKVNSCNSDISKKKMNYNIGFELPTLNTYFRCLTFTIKPEKCELLFYSDFCYLSISKFMSIIIM